MKSCRMKPDRNKSYGVKDPTIFNVLVFLVGTYLSDVEILVLSKLNQLCAEVVPEIKRPLKIDWRPVVKPRHDYNDQKHISMDIVDMATALALKCGLDPGRIVRTLGGEYTGEWGNAKQTLEAVKPVVSMSDYMHIERMLTSGCPYELNFEESTESK